VRDTIAFTRLPEEPKDIAAIYVNDMGQAQTGQQPEPGTWTEARDAWFVIESEPARRHGRARAGSLDLPPFELVEVLSLAAEVSRASDGVFDVTVQPLWQRLAGHFAADGAEPAGPDLTEAARLVDWRGVAVGPQRIALARPGMAVTLNGIAQGYITDQVADLLRREGMGSVLIDLGETKAVGLHPEARPWRVGLADPADPARVGRRVELTDAALATSGGYGTVFDAGGRHNHLIDPRSRRSAPARRSVSVVAPAAAIADAASTALALMPEQEAPELLRQLGARAAYIQDAAGFRKLRA
jgi:FAD:protein FMN transferase